MPEYRVSEQDVGLTLEEFLARKIPAAPLAYLRHLVKSGKIKNHQTELRLEHLVEPDETIQLPESNRLLSLIAKAEKTPEILFESREILILNKPSGLAIHRSRGHETDNLTDRINHWSTGGFSIAPIHRLDLQTSGPVLFGKGKKSCSELGKLMMVGGMIKTYLALVQGKPCRQERLTSEIPAKGKLKKAVTDYKIIATDGSASLLEIKLHTGRQHQIRRQLSDAGYPLFGDQRYQGPRPKGLPRLFLHCCRLELDDPFQDRAIKIESPLPEELDKFLRRSGISTQGD